MIRRLTEANRANVLDYLYQEPNFNIFPIGDIEAFGFDEDFQRVYGEIDDEGSYTSIFLRYRDNAIYYSHKNYFNPEYVDIFNSDKFKYLSGKKQNLEIVEKFLKGYEKRQMYFAEAKYMINEETKQDYLIKKIESEEDCKHLYKLLSTISEFATFHQNEDDFVQSKMKSIEMGVTLYIEVKGEVVSSVATTAETTKSAMVVGVATKPEFRNKGLATILMQRLMEIYLRQKNKELCLFYDNPAAGKIYKRLGFNDIGLWLMYEFGEDEAIK